MRILSCSELVRPLVFLFLGRTPDKSIEPTVLHAACRSAVKAAGLDKRVSVHVLLVDYRERHGQAAQEAWLLAYERQAAPS